MNIVHTESSLGWGGQEIRILNEAQGMQQRGHQVTILCPADANLYSAAIKRNIAVEALPMARKNIRGLIAMVRWLKAHKVDVINSHSSTDSWLVALASLLAGDSPPLVRTRHISAPVAKNWTTRWLYTRASRYIVTTGESLREHLIRDIHCRDCRVCSVPTGIDIELFQPGDKQQARTALGLEASVTIIGIVATLRSWKGHLHLLAAFAQLAKQDEQLRLLIVGDGPMQDVLEAKVAQLGIAAKVQFTGRQESVVTWLQAMDVFCLPSYANEGVPQALLQAMLVTLPVVSTSIGGIPEALQDGVTGLMVPPKDDEALLNALQWLLSHPSEAQQMGRAARDKVVAKFALTQMLTRMESIFSEVITRNTKPRKTLSQHWSRLQRSLTKRWENARLPKEYVRLGTQYGGWWLDQSVIGAQPLVLDCGLGRDISFPAAFLARFGGQVIGIDPNPESIEYCEQHCPPNMQIMNKALWTQADQALTFHMPRAREQLPLGADGVSGSLVDSHDYVEGGTQFTTNTTSFEQLLDSLDREECDVLKLDIEGAEYEVLAHLCESGELIKIRQLLVEFHHNVTHHTLEQTQSTIESIQEVGFQLIHREGRNYIFRRKDLG